MPFYSPCPFSLRCRDRCIINCVIAQQWHGLATDFFSVVASLRETAVATDILSSSPRSFQRAQTIASYGKMPQYRIGMCFSCSLLNRSWCLVSSLPGFLLCHPYLVVALVHIRKSMLTLMLPPLEISPNNRAGCHEAACKKDSVKILKGEIRFGSWVEIKEHGSWSWKHWYVTCLRTCSFVLIDS